jgi:hypothetical protein
MMGSQVRVLQAAPNTRKIKDILTVLFPRDKVLLARLDAAAV